MRYVKTGHCIWCGKTEPDVSFRAAPHIVPHNLGSDDIGFDVCDDCNHYLAQVRKSVDGPPGMLTEDYHRTVHVFQ